MSDNYGELVNRILGQCDGHPAAWIKWPHRILHEAADAITALVKDAAADKGALSVLAKRAEAAETEVVRLRELVFNVAKAAIPEWKKEFQRAAQFEAKLAVIEANNEKGKS